MSRKTLHLLQEIATLYDQTERFMAIRIEMRTVDGERLLSGGGTWWIAGDGDLWPSRPVLYRAGPPKPPLARRPQDDEAFDGMDQDG
jgi:hypothetical protein